MYESMGVMASSKGVAITAAGVDGDGNMWTTSLGCVFVRTVIVGLGDAPVGAPGVPSV